MKTIEEAAKEFGRSVGDGTGNIDCANTAMDGFEAGVEFAQRWIDVKDELPLTDDIKYLVRTKSDGICLLPFNNYHQCWDDEDGDDYFTDAIGGKVTHWRPIELK